MPASVIDLGCGLGTELAYLKEQGCSGVGIDRSAIAIGRAAAMHPGVAFAVGDVRALPIQGAAFDLALDRGCFHYLDPGDRGRYVSEVRRVLRPGGRLFLRACLRAAGVRNDIGPKLLLSAFVGWRVLTLAAERIATDGRDLDALVALLERDARP
jgi:SAM-dependent methyltransferase